MFQDLDCNLNKDDFRWLNMSNSIFKVPMTTLLQSGEQFMWMVFQKNGMVFKCSYKRTMTIAGSDFGVIHLVRAQSSPKNDYFLPPDALLKVHIHTWTCISGGKKWSLLTLFPKLFLLVKIYTQTTNLRPTHALLIDWKAG